MNKGYWEFLSETSKTVDLSVKSTTFRDHLKTAGTVSKLRLVCQTKSNLVDNNYDQFLP